METKISQLKKMLEDREMDVLFARVASTILSKGNVDEAVDVCENGVKKYPMYAQGHYILGKCYDQQGKAEEAKTEYERAVKYDPNHLKAIYRLAEIYQLNGMDEQSREKISVLQFQNPFDHNVIKMAQSAGLTDKKEEKRDKEDAPVPVDNTEEPLDVDKVDLSQFDNTDDDFTTIIQGKEEEAEQQRKHEDINLSLGTAGEDLVADTDVNDRVVYEEEIRLRRESEAKAAEKSKEYEDLDELKFEKEESGKPETKTGGDWAMPISEREATEILIKKNDSKSSGKAKKPKPPASSKSEAKDPLEDSDFKQPKIVTQTLGEILVSQKKYLEALRVFETLQEQHPDNNNISKKVDFLKKIVALEQK